MSTNTRKKISLALVVCLSLTLVVGSLAYFTDRLDLQATGTSGNVQIESTAFAGANDSNVLVDRDGKDNLNPGDVRDLTFIVSNEGNKAVDVRHTIKLTVLDGAGAALDLTDENGNTADQLEFDIYLKDDVSYTTAKGYEILNNAKPIFSSSTYDEDTEMGVKRVVENNTVTYFFADTTLLGKNGVDNAERTATPSVDEKNIEINDTSDTVTYEYVLVYRDTTLNRFMNSQLTVDMIVEAKQHYNTEDDWSVVAQQSFTAGNLVKDSTPDHAEDTVGGSAVNGKNTIDPHEDIKGGASVTNGALETELAPTP